MFGDLAILIRQRRKSLPRLFERFAPQGRRPVREGRGQTLVAQVADQRGERAVAYRQSMLVDDLTSEPGTLEQRGRGPAVDLRVDARGRPLAIGGKKRLSKLRERSGANNGREQKSAPRQCVSQMDKRAGEVVHGVEFAQADDEIIGATGQRPLEIDLGYRGDPLGRSSVRCQKQGPPDPGDERVVAIETKKSEPFEAILGHGFWQPSRSTGSGLANERAGRSCRSPSRLEDEGNLAGHCASVPFTGPRRKR